MTNRIHNIRIFRGPLAEVVQNKNGEAVLIFVETPHEEWSLTPMFEFAFYILKNMIDGSEQPLSRQLKGINIDEINTLLRYKGLVDLLFSLFDNGGGSNWKYQRLMLCAYADWKETGLPTSACGYWCHETLRWMADNLGDFAITITPPFQEIGKEMMQIAECHDGVLTIEEQSVYED